MPPKAANERFGAKPEMGIMTYHRKAATQIYLSRAAGFFFLSFVPARLALRSIAGRRKLRKRKENPADPVNPVR
jgi:hypothetical protein